MSDAPLTTERILTAAEDALRRFGPAKATVIDVARALGVSHGSVYKHFPSKSALWDAVARVWLDRVTDPLKVIVAEDAPATDRLRRWLEALIAVKRKRAFEDPELFATYNELAAGMREVVADHVAELSGQIAKIVEDGVRRGEFVSENPAATGRAVLSATARFHNPAHAAGWRDPDIDTSFEEVWNLILCGLQSRSKG